MKKFLSGLLVLCLLVSGFSFLLTTQVSAAADPNLKLWYQFNETSGTTIVDSSGNSNSGTLVGGASLGNSSVSLNGTNGAVKIPDNLTVGVTNITITAAVLVDTANTNPSWIFSFGSVADAGTAGSKYLGLLPDSNGQFRFALGTDRWNGEQSAGRSGSLSKGVWKNVALTISKNSGDNNYTGLLYEDGAEVARKTDMTVSANGLGNTLFNYIGRPAYAGDKWFKGQISDFRVYTKALSETEIRTVMFDNITDAQAVQLIKPKLSLGNTSAVISNLPLPTQFEGGVTASWSSDDPSVIANDGKVVRSSVSDKTVNLTATISRGSYSETKAFTLTVLQFKTIYLLDSTAYTLSFVNASHNTVLTAYYTNGTMEDVTNQATAVSSDDTIATVDASGLVQGKKEGTATITFTLLGVNYLTNVTVVKEPSLKLWYKMNEKNGTVATDSSGNGNDGTLSAGAAWSTGLGTDGSIQFNGTNGSVQMPNNLLTGITNITLSSNVYVDPSNPKSTWIFSFANAADGGSAANNTYFGLIPKDNIGTNGNFRGMLTKDRYSAEQSISRSGVPLSTGVWENIALTISKNSQDNFYTGTLYENGVEIAKNRTTNNNSQGFRQHSL